MAPAVAGAWRAPHGSCTSSSSTPWWVTCRCRRHGSSSRSGSSAAQPRCAGNPAAPAAGGRWWCVPRRKQLQRRHREPARSGSGWVQHTVRTPTCLTGTRAGVLVSSCTPPPCLAPTVLGSWVVRPSSSLIGCTRQACSAGRYDTARHTHHHTPPTHSAALTERCLASAAAMRSASLLRTHPQLSLPQPLSKGASTPCSRQRRAAGQAPPPPDTSVVSAVRCVLYCCPTTAAVPCCARAGAAAGPP